jgi:hypothetical protein
MKHLYTVSLSLLTVLWAHGQITIGQAEMPAANDELVRVQAVTNPFINYGATGPAYTWNFANLAANSGDTTNYQSVASTNFVYAIVYSDIFFNSNRANHAKPGTDIAFSQLLPVQDPYTFRYRSSSVYKTVGYGVELSGIPVPIIFDEHDVIYELPLEYGDASSSSSSYSVDIPSVGSYAFEQVRTNVVDGWGAITTPGGVFDVLRVKTTLNMRDSLFGIVIDRPVVREYKWMAQGLRVPVLQINTTTIFGTEVVNAIYYYDVPRTIEVVAPLATTLCPGATVPVNYTSTGAFNAGGFFVPANQFRAQLSDANGSFAAPVNIGSVTATSSGTITATIPANTPPGTGYRIRVISTSPDYIGESNAFNISIGGPTVASISAQGSTLLCTGETLVLTAVGGPSYQWQRDGSDIIDAIGETLSVTEAGAYTVLVDNACGSDTSDPIVVELNPVPTHVMDETAYLICAGSEVSFTAHDVSGQAELDYQWFLNDAPIQGATDSTIVAGLAGLYTAVVTNATTGCTFTTEPVDITVEALPIAELTVDGSTTFCAGGEVMLSTSGNNGSSYQWFLDGEIVEDATENTWTATISGAYTVVVTSPSGCASEVSLATTVIVEPVPLANVAATEPTTFCEGNGVTLIADPIDEADYQWMLNGSPIDGATGTQLMVTESGSFTVMVTATNGCSALSTPAIDVVVNPLPVAEVAADGSTSFCAGGAVNLITTGPAGSSYQWYLDGVLVDGATEDTWTATASGSYGVVITSDAGCASDASAPVMVTVDPAPVVNVSATEPTTFCEGNGVTLIADPIDDADYQWMVDGATINGGTAPQLTVTESGSYTVMVTAANGCSAQGDPAIDVVVNPLPDAPVITNDGEALVASGTGTYQWYLDGIIIDGATAPTWVPIQNGSYTVELTDGNGCSSTSEVYLFLSTGVDAVMPAELLVVPNPSNGSFVIEQSTGQGGRFEILDATGKRVLTGRFDGQRTAVDMLDAEQGIYFLRMLDRSAMPVLRIAITR